MLFCLTRLRMGTSTATGMVREGWALEAIFESQLIVREPFLAVDGRVIAQNSYGLE